MSEQKLKPGHFWAKVWCDDTDKRKRIVIDTCGPGCIAVRNTQEEKYFDNGGYITTHWEHFQKLEPPTMRYMTNEEMAEFVIDNPCITKYKTWEDEWIANMSVDNANDPKDWLWKKRFKDDWQEFLIEDNSSKMS